MLRNQNLRRTHPDDDQTKIPVPNQSRRCIYHLFTLEIMPASQMDDSAANPSSALLRERQHDLERRERALKIAEETFEEEREKTLFGNTSPTDVLELNVGGTLCTALRRTLCQMEGSMLASRFSGRWDESLEKDAAGRFVIDQSFEFFGPLLQYLRDMSNESQAFPKVRPPFFKDESKQHSFQRMLDYYGCLAWVYRYEIVLLKGVRNDTVISQYPGRHEVETKQESIFALLNEGLVIDAFEIEFGAVAHAAIGWVEHLTSKDIAQFQVEKEPDMYKVERLKQSIFAFDNYNEIAVNINGSVCTVDLPDELLPMKQGAVIRCERHECSLYINGILIFHSNPGTCMEHNHTPIFACSKGKARVARIELARRADKDPRAPVAITL
jgi:hypothetical protein